MRVPSIMPLGCPYSYCAIVAINLTALRACQTLNSAAYPDLCHHNTEGLGRAVLSAKGSMCSSTTNIGCTPSVGVRADAIQYECMVRRSSLSGSQRPPSNQMQSSASVGYGARFWRPGVSYTHAIKPIPYDYFSTLAITSQLIDLRVLTLNPAAHPEPLPSHHCRESNWNHHVESSFAGSNTKLCRPP
jgi:hypothetical protein